MFMGDEFFQLPANMDLWEKIDFADPKNFLYNSSAYCTRKYYEETFCYVWMWKFNWLTESLVNRYIIVVCVNSFC